MTMRQYNVSSKYPQYSLWCNFNGIQYSCLLSSYAHAHSRDILFTDINDVILKLTKKIN